MRLQTGPHWQYGNVRLFLLDESHVGSAYVGWMADPEINRFLESRFSTHDEDSIRAYVRAMRESPADLLCGIHSIELDRHVGNIKLGPILREHGRGEIGIMIGDRDAWGRGIGSDAIAAICTVAKQDIGLRKITAGCYAGNVGSQRAFEKVGFAVEGIRPRHFVIEGQDEALVLLARFV
jgi:RimJ/RimL family protein N-acetyltransferase